MRDTPTYNNRRQIQLLAEHLSPTTHNNNWITFKESRNLFTSCGVPEEIASDGGSQFTCSPDQMSGQPLIR